MGNLPEIKSIVLYRIVKNPSLDTRILNVLDPIVNPILCKSKALLS